MSSVDRNPLIRAPQWQLYLKLIAVAFFWGGTFIAGRHLAPDVHPHLAAIGRFGIAAILLVILVIRKHAGWVWISPSQLLYTAIMGFTGICIYNLFFLGALNYIEAGRSALFVSLSPVMTVVAAAIIFKEKLSKLNYFGVLLAFLGTIIVVSRGQFSSLLDGAFGQGEAMMSGAVCCWVIYTLCIRKVAPLSAQLTTTYAILWGLLFLLVSAIPQLESWQAIHISTMNWLAMLYLGALGTVLAFVWYAQGIEQIGASRTVIFNNLVPCFAVILSFFLLKETVTWAMLLGGIFCFAGVILTNKKAKSGSTVQHQQE